MEPQLPLEILVHIATTTIDTFAKMLALPPIARFLFKHRSYVIDKFTTIVVEHCIVNYYVGAKLHREDGPAIEYPSGTKEWYINGKLHRDGDLPAVECALGTKSWYQRGMLHRVDGPAVEHAYGSKEWYQWGKRHREGAPAVEYSHGVTQWWIHGKRLYGSSMYSATYW